MRTWTARPATDEAFVLAEGPVWDAARSRLLWVDIPRGTVLEGELVGDRVRVTGRREFEGTVGAVTVAVDGRLLVAGQERLIIVAADGGRNDAARIVPVGEARRLNDGKTDPMGRFVVGTLAFGESTREVLVRLKPDGSLEEIDAGLTLSNGLAWSLDGSLMYSVDTLVGCVWVRDYEPATGATGPRRLFLSITDGFPDGLCTDVDGHLWVAIWGRGEVRRFDRSGKLVGRVEVPAPHTSSVAFVGPDLDVLVITSATDELDAEQLEAYPGSGRLFLALVDTVGVPVPPWNPEA